MQTGVESPLLTEIEVDKPHKAEPKFWAEACKTTRRKAQEKKIDFI